MGITIASTNKEVLTVFQQEFKGTIQSPKQSEERIHQKKMHYLVMGKKVSLIFHNKIVNFLVEKKEEAEIFINFATADRQEKDVLINEMRNHKKFINLVQKDQKQELDSIKKTVKPTREDFAYLAGFIDAECCFSISKYKPKDRPNYTYKIMLQCNNSKYPCFKWIIERFGGHINFIDRNSKDASQRNQFCWGISAKALSEIINKIHPFLIYKKQVCQELINFYKTTIKIHGDRASEKFKSHYDRVLIEREIIVNNVHRLNLKGI